MNYDVDIIYEDERIVAVNKPSGLLSSPDRYDPDAPVASRLLEERLGRLWPVHRLDKDTSGVLVFARDEDAHRELSIAFEDGLAKKRYVTAVRGRPSWAETVCELPLTPDGDRLHRTVIDGSGKPSATEFSLIHSFGPLSALEARPRTGRTHQIRVHLAALGYPVACDPLYGDGEPIFLSKVKRKWKGDPYGERPLISRTALHALGLELPRPGGGEPLSLEAPLPKDMRALFRQMQVRL